MTASHAHPTTTLNHIPRVAAEPLESNGPPKTPSTMARPLSSERRESERSFRRDIARAARKQLTARATNPVAPAMKWTNPTLLIDVGNPNGIIFYS